MNYAEMYLKECVLILSMSITEKVFHYEESEISVIKCKDDIWFRVRTLQKH